MPFELMLSKESTDAALLEAWRSGDAAAGEMLFARHYRSLKRFFRNKVTADRLPDLIQETFVASVESRDRITDSSRFRPYLLRIAYHVFCAHVRERYRGGHEADLDDFSLAAVETSASVLVARAQEQRLLLEGLRKIPVNYQVVLELHYWEECSVAEISATLEIPAGTVKSRLRRGREQLRAAVERLAVEPGLAHSTLHGLETWAKEVRVRVAREPGF